METNPATGLPMISTSDYGGNPIGSDDYTGRRDIFLYDSSNRKETKEESNLNDLGAYVMLVLGSGFLVYSFYGVEIEAILKKIF